MKRNQWIEIISRIINDIEDGRTPVPVTELYAIGPFARGEADPQVLDLIVIHDEPSDKLLESYRKEMKSSRSVISQLAGGMRRFEQLMLASLCRKGEHINIHRGYELCQALPSTGHQKQDILLIWSATDRDWQAKLQGA